ncbi:hypothetical protein HaLaN_32256, partial [Haematococcus lacustris]
MSAAMLQGQAKPLMLRSTQVHQLARPRRCSQCVFAVSAIPAAEGARRGNAVSHASWEPRAPLHPSTLNVTYSGLSSGLVRSFFDSMNQRDLAAMVALLDPNVTYVNTGLQ